MECNQRYAIKQWKGLNLRLETIWRDHDKKKFILWKLDLRKKKIIKSNIKKINFGICDILIVEFELLLFLLYNFLRVFERLGRHGFAYYFFLLSDFKFISFFLIY